MQMTQPSFLTALANHYPPHFRRSKLFGIMSGLRLNSKKTEALWIGSMVGNKEKLLPEKNFKWPENKVKVLGVWLSTDPNITLNINYREKADRQN